MLFSRLSLIAVPLVALSLSACSAKGVSTFPAETQDDTLCKKKRDECFATQQICVAEGAKETCQACKDGTYAKNPDMCESIPGIAEHHKFDPYPLDPAEEIDGLCQSWSLGNETELWVNAVELETDGGYHHSNWLFAPDDKYPGPDGAWKCKDRGYSELEAAVAGGVLFAQSTQAKRQVQKFPDGVAVRLPPHVKIIGGIHMFNVTTEPLETNLTLSLYTVPDEYVKVPLAPFRLSYVGLTIPPEAISEFTGECDLAGAIMGGGPTLDMDLYYVLPHYHSLGHSFHLEAYGGDDDGKVIYDLGAFDGEAHGTAFDPPISMNAAKGFRFSCGYENPRSEQVGWGIGDQEMCVMLGFARSDYAFDASVGTGEAVADKGRIREFTGKCSVLPLEFARGKGQLAPMPSTN